MGGHIRSEGETGSVNSMKSGRRVPEHESWIGKIFDRRKDHDGSCQNRGLWRKLSGKV
jgi:hypothetical protein